jgi:hypothetical protein
MKLAFGSLFVFAGALIMGMALVRTIRVERVPRSLEPGHMSSLPAPLGIGMTILGVGFFLLSSW